MSADLSGLVDGGLKDFLDGGNKIRGICLPEPKMDTPHHTLGIDEVRRGHSFHPEVSRAGCIRRRIDFEIGRMSRQECFGGLGFLIEIDRDDPQAPRAIPLMNGIHEGKGVNAGTAP
jgi:hypothetical protein